MQQGPTHKEQKSLIKTLMHGGTTAGVQTCWKLTSCQYFSRGFGTSKRGKRTTNPEIRLAKISPAISLLCFIDAADIVQVGEKSSIFLKANLVVVYQTLTHLVVVVVVNNK